MLYFIAGTLSKTLSIARFCLEVGAVLSPAVNGRSHGSLYSLALLVSDCEFCQSDDYEILSHCNLICVLAVDVGRGLWKSPERLGAFR